MTDFAHLEIKADSTSVKKATADLDKMSAAEKKVKEGLDKMGGSGKQASSQLDKVYGSAGKVSTNLNKTTASSKKAAEGLKKAGASGKKAGEDVKKGASKMSESMKKAHRSANVLRAAIAAIGVTSLLLKFKKTAETTELLKGQLVTMTGSVDNAGLAFDRLVDFAKKTPFTLDKSVQAFVKLKALGLDPSEKALMSYGNTASAMGKDMLQMIEAVADASTMEFERLKEFGIKAKQQGENVTFTFQGVSTTVKKEADAIQKYLTGIGENTFGDAMANQMERLPGLLSNLEDQVDSLFRQMSDDGGLEIFKSAVNASSSGVEFLSDNLDTMADIAKALAVIMAVNLTSSAVKSTTALIAQSAATLAATTTTNAFGVVIGRTTVLQNVMTAATGRASAALMLFGGPLGATALAVIGIVALIKSLDNQAEHFDKVRAALKSLTKEQIENSIVTQERTIVTIQATIERTERLNMRIAANRKVLEGQQKRLRESQRILADYKRKLVEMTRETDENTESVDENAASVLAAAEATKKQRQAVQDLIGKLASEQAQLHMTGLEQAIYNNMLALGADATDEQRQRVVELTTSLYGQKAALEATATEEAKLAKASEETAKLLQLQWMNTRDAFADFFVDFYNNGNSAFDALLESFKNMLIRMAAQWAASELLKLLGLTPGVLGTLIGGVIGSPPATGTTTGSTGGGVAGAVTKALGGCCCCCCSGGSGSTGDVNSSTGGGNLVLSDIISSYNNPNDPNNPNNNGGGSSSSSAGDAATSAVVGKVVGVVAEKVAEVLVGDAVITGASTAAGSGAAGGAASSGGVGLGAIGAAAGALAVGYVGALLVQEYGPRSNSTKITNVGVGGGSSTGFQSGTSIDPFGSAAYYADVYNNPEMFDGQNINATVIGNKEYGRNADDTTTEKQYVLIDGKYVEVDEDEEDGSNKNGLKYVPFDGYRSKNHEGEAILNKQDAEQFRSQGIDSFSTKKILLSMLSELKKSGRLDRKHDVNGFPVVAI